MRPLNTAPALASVPPANYGGVVSARVSVIVLRKSRLLLGRRKDSHGAVAWFAPGGCLEFGESIVSCAQRELLRETGMRLGLAEPGPYANDFFAESHQQFLTAFVVARCTSGAPRVMEPHKCECWDWFAWDELPAPLFAPVQSLIASGFVPD